MVWNRVRELLDLDDELETFGLLRDRIPSTQLYQVDRRAWLVAAIERMLETEDDSAMRLLLSEDD